MHSVAAATRGSGLAATGLTTPLKAVPETVILNLSPDGGSKGSTPGTTPRTSSREASGVDGTATIMLPSGALPGTSSKALTGHSRRHDDDEPPLKTMSRDDTSSTTATMTQSLASMHSQSRTSDLWGAKPSADPSVVSLVTAATMSSSGISADRPAASSNDAASAGNNAGAVLAEGGGAPHDGAASIPVGAASPPVPPGEGHGSLYKCAICGVLVYESQLDHHVLICPDPADGGGQRSARDSGVPDTIDEGDPSFLSSPAPKQDKSMSNDGDGSEPTMMPSQVDADSSSNAAANSGEHAGAVSDVKTKKAWTYEDSELSVHHEAMNQRSNKRRTMLAEERRKREEEECTFAPKILPRGSPRVNSRPVVTVEASTSRRWVQRGDEQKRTNRLKQVEAQVYADVTHRPKISRFARVWSQRQNEAAATEGMSHPTVFDRLYSTGVQARIVREEAAASSVAAAPSACSAEDLPPSTASIGCLSTEAGSATPGAFKPLSRRVPTTDLLYSDAMDRRERLRALAAQLRSQKDEPKVLGRSRRYYWQMLERQIKAAFDVAAGGESCLTFSKLEDFLIHFGCARITQRSGMGSARCGFGASGELPQEKEAASVGGCSPPDDEAGKLRQSLWRHLDPQNTGQVDLLSVTVFFHVLMGAVDDAAKASQSFCQPGTTGGGHESARSGRDRLLSAITEEDGLIVEEVLPAGPGHAALAGANGAAASDEDGRRIVELLVRFDPIRLRSEFNSLYMHRLHYQAQHQGGGGACPPQPSVPEASERPNQTPEIDTRSRVMADRLAERHRSESGYMPSRVEVMLWHKQQSELKLEEKRRVAQTIEANECTFRPRTTPQPAELHSQATPRGTNRNEVLYNRGLSDKARREQQAAEEAAARAHAEVAACTFQPNTTKSLKSFSRHNQDGAGPVPRGFYESRQRMRAAFEAERQKRSQLADRLSKVTPAADPAALVSAQRAPVCSGLVVTGGDSVLPSSAKLNSIVDAACKEAQAVIPPLGGPLPPVAEERESRLAKTSRRVSGRGRGGSASPTPAGRQQSPTPRGTSPRRNSQPPVGRQRSVAESKLATSSSAGSAASGGGPSKGMPKALCIDAPGFTKDGGDATSMGSSESQDNAPPLVYVDVNIAPGQPPERIVIREGQSVSEVAADFAAKHVLTPLLAQRLHSLLREVMQRQEHCGGSQDREQR